MHRAYEDYVMHMQAEIEVCGYIKKALGIIKKDKIKLDKIDQWLLEYLRTMPHIEAAYTQFDDKKDADFLILIYVSEHKGSNYEVTCIRSVSKPWTIETLQELKDTSSYNDQIRLAKLASKVTYEYEKADEYVGKVLRQACKSEMKTFEQIAQDICGEDYAKAINMCSMVAAQNPNDLLFHYATPTMPEEDNSEQ